jgi:hypothetical protein
MVRMPISKEWERSYEEEVMFRPIFAIVSSILIAIPGFAAPPQKPDGGQDKNLDVRSSVGDLHVGSDADARKIGLPLYPGARLRSDDESQNKANLSLFTEAFGFKLVVASYESDDAPAKVIDFYRDKLKKYGKVLECRSKKHGGDIDVHDDDRDSKGSKELRCEGDNTGPVTELKVGTEDDQRVVAIEPNDHHSGSTFALVYVHTRGKQGDI